MRIFKVYVVKEQAVVDELVLAANNVTEAFGKANERYSEGEGYTFTCKDITELVNERGDV